MIAEDNIEYLEHMTDAHVRCKGKTLAESFQYSAKGLVNIMYDINNIEKKQKVPLFAEGFDLENLLFDWLEKVLLLLLIRHGGVPGGLVWYIHYFLLLA